jgi:hypothetical protein
MARDSDHLRLEGCPMVHTTLQPVNYRDRNVALREKAKCGGFLSA